MAINSSFRTLSADNMEGVVYARNYLKNSFENNSTTGWNRLTTSMSGPIPTAATVNVGSAGSISTFAASATSPLNGKYSLNIASSGIWSAGQGFISDGAFTIDRMDAGKVLTVSFDYEVVSGAINANFSGILGSQTFMVYIYDVTAGAWIQPAGFLGMNQSSGPGRVTCTFQSSVTAGQQYRVAVIASVATSGAVSLRFDNLSCSRQTAPIGPVVTDWVSYTPTVTYFSGGATNVTHAGRWRRVGDQIEIDVTSSFSNTSAAFIRPFYSLPSGLSFDTSKMPSSIETKILGYGEASDAGNNAYPLVVGYRSSTQFFAFAQNASTSYSSFQDITNTIPFTFNSGDEIQVRMTAPISGWSSNVQLSNDTDTRVVAFAANKSATQSILNTTNTVIDFNSVEINTHGSTYAAGAYTVPVSGYYKVAFNFNFSTPGSNTIFGLLYKNGLPFCRLSAQPYSSSQSGGSGSTVIYLNAGENVSIGVFQSSGSAQILEGAGRFSVERLSGPSVVAASETVAMRAVSATTAVGTGTTTVVFSSKEYDTHNIYSTSTGAISIPVSGKYSIRVITESPSGASASTANAGTYLMIYKGNPGSGVINTLLSNLRWPLATGTGMPVILQGGTTVQANAGDVFYITQQRDASISAYSLSGTATTNVLVVERVGN